MTEVVRPDDAVMVRTLSSYNCTGECSSAATSCRSKNQCPLWLATTPPTPEEQARYADDPRCAQDESSYSSGFSGPVVGTYADFVRLFKVESEAARRVLAAGGSSPSTTTRSTADRASSR